MSLGRSVSVTASSVSRLSLVCLLFLLSPPVSAVSHHSPLLALRACCFTCLLALRACLLLCVRACFACLLAGLLRLRLELVPITPATTHSLTAIGGQAVAMYARIMPLTIPTPVHLVATTNAPLVCKTRWFCEDSTEYVRERMSVAVVVVVVVVVVCCCCCDC